jgi:phosphoribosylglycinamide formyltransferase 1
VEFFLFFAPNEHAEMKKFGIAILASGSGTNAEKIILHFRHHPWIEVRLLISNNPQAMALERAGKLNIPGVVFSKEQFSNEKHVLDQLASHGITHIVLAGFLWLIPHYLLHAFPDRIINIHPALLPKFGGKGMYGSKVHQAVKDAGETQTGITIHLVNEHYDDGKVLFQTSCSVTPDYSAAEIANCVHQLEYEHYPKVIEKWILAKDH